MDVVLNVPFVDTSAAHLGWSLGHEPLPSLATREVPFGAGTAQLRLLGASHQVLLDTSAGSLSEVVAYLDSEEPHLPGRAHRKLSGLAYCFRSRVRSLPSDAWFAAVVRRLVRRTSTAPYGLVGRFPGTEHAITALLAEPIYRRRGSLTEPDRITWRTWHAYPQTREIASTRTRVKIR